MYLKYYARVVLKIVSTLHGDGRLRVLYYYFRLIIKSIIHHKIISRKRLPGSEIHTENVLGFTIRFFTYAQLINLFEEIFIFQVYNFRSPGPAPFIIDGGSNIGLSVLYFKKMYPASWIIAFEPDKETFILLKENIRRNNLQQVSAFNFALQDTEGEMVLHKKTDSPGSLTMSLISSPAKLQREMVHARKLSDYIPGTVSMMKLDVEGSEVSIINDLIQTQKIEFVERMIIEYHPAVTNLSTEEFASRIRKCNFSCRYGKDEIHPHATEVMMHCVNKDYTRQTR